MHVETRREARWELWPGKLWCPESNRNAMAVFTGYGDPPPLMKPVAAFLPLRGIPPDASFQVLESQRREPCPYASWLLLSELLDFDWHGRRVTHLYDPAKSIPPGYLTPPKPDGTWTETYAEFVGPEVMEFLLPQLESLSEPGDVRVNFRVM
jgi:hypothetical protein